MRTSHIVSVSFSGGVLSVDSPLVTLQDPQDTVSWIGDPATFPANSALLIQFDQPFGPFQAIRSVSPFNMLAKGNTANLDLFTYSLLLATGVGSNLVKAGPFTIDNQCIIVNTSPWVQIEATQSGEGVWNLIPQNPPLSLHQGDDGILEVSGLPPDFIFAFFYETGSPNQGPFSTFFSTRQNGTGDQRMYVATFESDAVASHSYHISLWNELGQLLDSQDPSIDGLGRPPGT
jgi:hypothetical protein